MRRFPVKEKLNVGKVVLTIIVFDTYSLSSLICF